MFNFPIAPPSASNWAAPHDAIFYALTLLTLVFTLAVGFFVVFFAIRYRAGSRADRSRPVYEALALELTWTIIPLILALMMFFASATLFVQMKTPPKNAEDIFVVGKQWMWHIEHRNGVRENNALHVPVDQPVKLTMISQDVIHDFYVPAFRMQWMVVPGRYTTMWFTPTEIGKYHLFCNMYCGTQHSEMGGSVYVMSRPDYNRWLANQGESATPMTMEQAGARLYNKIGCENCHGAVDTPRAPSLLGIFGKTQNFENGPQKVTEETLRQAILRPYDNLLKGYDKTMPEYETQISEADVLNLIAYVKSAGTVAVPAVAGLSTTEGAAAHASGLDENTSLSTNSVQARTEDQDVTPTLRNNTPAVGAIAARGGN